MKKVDLADLFTGSVIMLLGIAVGFYSWGHYELGTFSRMGPGMFPLCLGITIALFGMLILVPALARAGDLPEIDFRSVLMIGASVVGFALTVERFGMIPAVTVLTFLAVAADSSGNWKRAVALSVVLNVLAISIFLYGLELPIRILRMPF